MLPATPVPFLVWETESRAVVTFMPGLTSRCICQTPFLGVPIGGEGRATTNQSPYLEELDPDAGEHELKQCGDNHNVANGPDGDEHTLNHVLPWERRQEGVWFQKEPAACAPFSQATGLSKEAA